MDEVEPERKINNFGSREIYVANCVKYCEVV